MIYEQGFSATFLETPVELFLALEFLSGPPIAERVCLGDPCPMTLVYEALPPGAISSRQRAMYNTRPGRMGASLNSQATRR